MERNHKTLWELGPAMLLAASLPLSAYADDPTINRMLAGQCSQCHGTNGYAVGDIDSLAGESVGEIRDELREMKADRTPDDMMDHQALGYTDDQIRRIAEYFAALPEKDAAGAPAIFLRPSGSSQDDSDAEDNDDHEDDRDQSDGDDSDDDSDHDEDRDRKDRYADDDDRANDRGERDENKEGSRDRDNRDKESSSDRDHDEDKED